MASERGPKERFIELVDAGVQPTIDLRNKGFYRIPRSGEEVDANLQMNDLHLHYFRGKPTEGIRGIHGFDFIPSHGFEVSVANTFSNRTNTHASFGLDTDGEVQRVLQEPDHGFGINILQPRKLDEEETDELLAFMLAPHIARKSLEVALRKTKEEAEKMDAMHASSMAAYDKYIADLREQERLQREAWFDSRNTVIY